jgi:hypothetical protein
LVVSIITFFCLRIAIAVAADNYCTVGITGWRIAAVVALFEDAVRGCEEARVKPGLTLVKQRIAAQGTGPLAYICTDL